MSKIKQGYRFEKYCRDTLKQEGWIIAFKSQRIKFGKIDFIGLFDIIALQKTINPIKRLYVSCKDLSKGHGWLKNHKLAIKDFKDNYGLEGESFQIWVKKKREMQKIEI